MNPEPGLPQRKEGMLCFKDLGPQWHSQNEAPSQAHGCILGARCIPNSLMSLHICTSQGLQPIVHGGHIGQEGSFQHYSVPWPGQLGWMRGPYAEWEVASAPHDHTCGGAHSWSSSLSGWRCSTKFLALWRSYSPHTGCLFNTDKAHLLPSLQHHGEHLLAILPGLVILIF